MGSRALFLASLALLSGCGPSTHTLDAGVDSALPPRLDSGVPTGSVTFHVSRGSSVATAIDCAACAVSIVAPGPRRLETTTDASGNVTLSGFDWGADGRVSATFFAPEHTAFSISGWSEADYTAALEGGVFEIFLPWRTAPADDTVLLSGMAVGFSADPMAVLYVQSTAGGPVSAGRGAFYSMRVGTGATFDLLLTDFLTARGIDRSLVQPIARWALVEDVGPFSADATEDVDLAANALTPTSSSASFVMPDHPFFSDAESMPNVVGVALDGEILDGLATNLTVGADGRTVDFTLERVALPGVTGSRTVVSVTGPLGSSATVLDTLAPTGTIDPDFLVPPTIAGTASRPLFATVEIVGGDATLQPRVRLETTMGRPVWTIVGPVGASTVTMPAPPFETDDALLGVSGTPLYLDAQICEPAGTAAHRERCVRSATSAQILVAAP